jgi:hypothetical protein
LTRGPPAGYLAAGAAEAARQADAGLIKAGNPELRAVLIEAAQRLRRCDKRWAALSDRLTRAGKSGSVTTAAVANRWIRWLYNQVEAA